MSGNFNYDKQLRKLRSQQKALARKRKVHEKQGIESKTSKRYSKAKKDLRKTYAKISNQEIDYAHKLSKQLVDEYSIICLETLNVISMVKNRKLSRSISHSNWGRLVEFLEYKAKCYESVIIRIDRFYPSSKKCSNLACGQVKTKLDLSERTYSCEYCGLIIDRDVNAAVNIREEGLRLLLELVAQSCGDTFNGHGETSNGLDIINNLSETGFVELP